MAPSLKTHGFAFVSHAVALLAAIGALPLLFSPARNLSAAGFLGTLIFAATMVLLYFASTIHHALPHGRAKRAFLKLDYSAIYLFIAGSYTSFALGTLGGMWGWTLFALVWLLAAVGLFLKGFDRLAHPWLSTGLYLAMGWIVFFAAVPLFRHMPLPSMSWLGAGGLAYTVGVVFFVLDSRVRYSHAVWHGFVAAGTGCHTFAVLNLAV